MSPLQRTAAHLAGPRALGILIPPGSQTVLILRPRSLPWDLVLLKSCGSTTFRTLNQSEGHQVAEALYEALVKWSDGSNGHIGAIPLSEGEGLQIWMDVEDFSLIVCARNPGQPYQPLILTDSQQAEEAIGQLQAVLCPGANQKQEIYLNTRHFSQ